MTCWLLIICGFVGAVSAFVVATWMLRRARAQARAQARREAAPDSMRDMDWLTEAAEPGFKDRAWTGEASEPVNTAD